MNDNNNIIKDRLEYLRKYVYEEINKLKLYMLYNNEANSSTGSARFDSWYENKAHCSEDKRYNSHRKRYKKVSWLLRRRKYYYNKK